MLRKPFCSASAKLRPIAMPSPTDFMLVVNIAGVPAISIHAGFADGLPIGMQIIGKPFAEETILKIAYAYEQATEWHKEKPKI